MNFHMNLSQKVWRNNENRYLGTLGEDKQVRQKQTKNPHNSSIVVGFTFFFFNIVDSGWLVDFYSVQGPASTSRVKTWPTYWRKEWDHQTNEKNLGLLSVIVPFICLMGSLKNIFWAWGLENNYLPVWLLGYC